jgi:hypothetical protein
MVATREINFQRLSAPYLHGYMARSGNKFVEVVRTDSHGQWHAFLYEGGNMIPAAVKDTTKHNALRIATEFLSK